MTKDEEEQMLAQMRKGNWLRELYNWASILGEVMGGFAGILWFLILIAISFLVELSRRDFWRWMGWI
jgi:hypothetical protein